MEKVIVSLTSYPKRIATIHKVLDSIIAQTIRPDKIILYLSSSEFNGFCDMPNLEKYKEYGFEIHWNEENLKSHKKWFYAFQEYPEDMIITLDDDVIYDNTALETLLRYHNLYPKDVIARNVHLITCNEDGKVALYAEWCQCCSEYVGQPRMDLMAVGNAGILYPPHIFKPELFNKKVFMENAQYADDIWMKIMEVYSDIEVVLAETAWSDPILEELQMDCLYGNYNKNGGNDKQLKSLLEAYPCTHKNESLINRIFKDGKTYAKDVGQIRERDVRRIITKLMKRINDCGELLVYGAGNVGRRICYLLKENHTLIIKAFIVENTLDNVSTIENIAVKDYREFIDSDEQILIALFNYNETEKVYKKLIQEGVNASRIMVLRGTEKEALMKGVCEPFNSGKYWEQRYIEGGNSGAGSYNHLADFKAKVINEFVKENQVNTVIEWGCGDGNQLKLAKYPAYIGLDVSKEAIKICKEIFSKDKTKKFVWIGSENFENNYEGDLAISLDVIYHLIENEVYDQYMRNLFASSKKYVCIYASNFEERTAPHVRNRKFTDWIEANVGNQWKLLKTVWNEFPYSKDDPNNTSWSDFYFFEKSEFDQCEQ